MEPVTPNILAYVVLLGWIPFTLWLFAKKRAEVATALSIIGAALFLPERVAINLPLVPDLDKTTVPVLGVFLGCMIFARSRLSAARPLRGIDWLLWLCLFADVGTGLTNPDVVFAKPPAPPLTAYDTLSTVLGHLVIPYLLFLFGRSMFRSSADLRTLLRICFSFGLGYTVLCLIELKMSPQLHNWTYGFMQHSFAQTLRGGGYRPMVFVSHGIVLARFLLVALLSGVLLIRVDHLRGRTLLALAWLAIVFVACKSTGAVVFSAVAAPLIAFTGSRAQLRVAQIFAVIVLLYPSLRATDLFPADDLVESAMSFSAERAASLGFRFDQEEILLAKARERLAFGWGGYGRSRVFDEDGKDISVTDGEWIIVLGSQGLVGFAAWYGMYLIPIFVAARNERFLRTLQDRLLLSGFALTTVLLAVDTLPNSSAGLPHFFFSGALYGIATGMPRHERLTRQRARREREAAASAAASASAPASA